MKVRCACLLASLSLLAACGESKSGQPKALRLSVQPNGSYSHAGKTLSKDDLRILLSVPLDVMKPKEIFTPIHLEVSPVLRMTCLKRVITDVFEFHCLNLSLVVVAPGGDTAVQFPVVLDKGPHLKIFDGKTEVALEDNQNTLEVVTRVAEGGALRVADTTWTREYVYYPETPGKQTSVPRWRGEHPPFGVWSVRTLQDFLTRADVAALNPYVTFEISWDDVVGDVISGLAALRSAAGSRVEPLLRAD